MVRGEKDRVDEKKNMNNLLKYYNGVLCGHLDEYIDINLVKQ